MRKKMKYVILIPINYQVNLKQLALEYKKRSDKVLSMIK
jgi:hypothetical protein